MTHAYIILVYDAILRYVKKCTKRDLIQNYIKSIPRGDWFVLYQLSKNLYRPFFMDFLTTLSIM